MKTIIVGSTGFIGKAIYQHLEQTKPNKLIGLSTKDVNLNSEKSHLALSKKMSSSCTIVMCAGVKKQLGDSLETFISNMAITTNFCKAVSKSIPKKIIYLSSASVYGEDVEYLEKISESTPVQPKTYYGIAKFTAEKMLEKTCAENGIELIILRPPLVYGKGDRSLGYGPTGFTYKAINNEEIILWGDGSEFREFVYIDDISKIVASLIDKNSKGVFNVVSGSSYSFNQVIEALSDILRKDIKVISRKRSKEKVDHHYSNECLAKTLKSFTFTSLSDGLTKMYQSIVN